MQLTPWAYKIPPLYFLKNEPAPIEKVTIIFEPIKKPIQHVAVTNNSAQLF